MPFFKGGGSATVRTPEIAISYSGQIGTTEVVNVVLTETLTLPASFAGSRTYSDDLATNTNALQVNIIHGGVSTLIGTVTFAPAGAAFSSSVSTTFVPGDTLQVVAPGTTDPTLFNPAITFRMNSDADSAGQAIPGAPFNYPPAGLVYCTGAGFQAATVQAPLALSGNILSVSCVFSLGGAVGDVALGNMLSMNNGTLNSGGLPLMNGFTAPSGVIVDPDGQAIGVPT